ncbi:hypothetical protein SUDANB121_01057 [Nocardiopsis dassonvillei]
MYVTHPARDLAPLTLAVRRWLSASTQPLPPSPVGGTVPLLPRVPEPRTSPETSPEASTSASPPALPPASPPNPVPVQSPVRGPAPVPASGFTAALAARPRIHALRAGKRTRTESDPAGHEPPAHKAPARLRARMTAHRNNAMRPAEPAPVPAPERSAAWLDARAASRILAWNLGRAA